MREEVACQCELALHGNSARCSNQLTVLFKRDERQVQHPLRKDRPRIMRSHESACGRRIGVPKLPDGSVALSPRSGTRVDALAGDFEQSRTAQREELGFVLRFHVELGGVRCAERCRELIWAELAQRCVYREVLEVNTEEGALPAFAHVRNAIVDSSLQVGECCFEVEPEKRAVAEEGLQPQSVFGREE